MYRSDRWRWRIKNRYEMGCYTKPAWPHERFCFVRHAGLLLFLEEDSSAYVNKLLKYNSRWVIGYKIESWVARSMEARKLIFKSYSLESTEVRVCARARGIMVRKDTRFWGKNFFRGIKTPFSQRVKVMLGKQNKWESMFFLLTASASASSSDGKSNWSKQRPEIVQTKSSLFGSEITSLQFSSHTGERRKKQRGSE